MSARIPLPSDCAHCGDPDGPLKNSRTGWRFCDIRCLMAWQDDVDYWGFGQVCPRCDAAPGSECMEERNGKMRVVPVHPERSPIQ